MGRMTEPNLRLNRTFRRIMWHTIKYSAMLIVGVFTIATSVIVSLIWLFTTYGSTIGLAAVAALAVSGGLVAFGYNLAKSYVSELERKEEELKRQMQRDASYR